MYRSPVVLATDTSILTGSVTDCPAAMATVAEALALVDETDFGIARDHDPNWPTHAEGTAVRALRNVRNALISILSPSSRASSPTRTPTLPAAAGYAAAEAAGGLA